MDLSEFTKIPDYPEYYINKNADIYSTKVKRIIKNPPNTTGYSRIAFSYDYVKYELLVHRLMAHTFLGMDLSTNYEVHHIDGNVSNNKLDNLEILTTQDHSKAHWDESGKRRCKRYCAYCGTLLYKTNKNMFCMLHRYDHQRIMRVVPIMETKKDFEILVDKFGNDMTKLASLFNVTDNGLKRRINKLK